MESATWGFEAAFPGRVDVVMEWVWRMRQNPSSCRAYPPHHSMQKQALAPLNRARSREKELLLRQSSTLRTTLTSVHRTLYASKELKTRIRRKQHTLFIATSSLQRQQDDLNALNKNLSELRELKKEQEALEVGVCHPLFHVMHPPSMLICPFVNSMTGPAHTTRLVLLGDFAHLYSSRLGYFINDVSVRDTVEALLYIACMHSVGSSKSCHFNLFQ